MPLNRASAAGATYESAYGCGCASRAPFYPTDLTDAQWALLEPALPVMMCLTEAGGRPELHSRRTMIDAVFYLVDNGIKWRAMPRDFPRWKTVYGLCARWKKDGVLADITGLLRAAARKAAGRDPEPSAAIVDAQSVHASAEGVVPSATSGYDPHKKVNGRKRHLLVDTLGLLIAVAVTPAGTQDRAGAAAVLKRARRRLAHVWGDQAYNGDWVHWAARELAITIEVVEHPPGQQGFQVLPRRWVVVSRPRARNTSPDHPLRTASIGGEQARHPGVMGSIGQREGGSVQCLDLRVLIGHRVTSARAGGLV